MVEDKWYASLFVGWVGPRGRTSWAADVCEDSRGLGIAHKHAAICQDDAACQFTDGWTPATDCTPAQAIAAAQRARDMLIEARLSSEGAPVLSDVLIDQLGDHDHLMAIHKACEPVWAAAARPRPRVGLVRRGLLAAAAIVGFIAAAATWWFLFHVH